MKSGSFFNPVKRSLFMAMIMCMSASTFAQAAVKESITDSMNTLAPEGWTWPLPLFEHWNYGFWMFWSLGGNGMDNWGISGTIGNPAPAAYFSRTPPVTNYETWLESSVLNARIYECADIYLEFDIKLTDVFMNQSENMLVQYKVEGGSWITVKQFTNAGSFDWQTESVVLNDVPGELFRIRFLATGSASTGIYYWYIDNIYVYAECSPPLNLSGSYLNDSVYLEWSSPACDFLKSDPVITGTMIDGYNIYRSDDFGESFHLIDALPVKDTQYVDHNVVFQGYHEYYVTTLYDVCESIPSDTAIVEYLNLIEYPGNEPFRINPVPAKNELTITLSENFKIIRVFNFYGHLMHQQMIGKEKVITVNTATYAAGPYLVQLTNENAETFTKRILIIP